jgi:Helix-turn-helix domain
MSEHDVLFGYRLQLVDLAGRIGVSAACRVFGVHRSTFYRWKRMIERHGLEILRPRERRRPRMPNQLSPSSRRGSSPSRSATPVSDRRGSPPSFVASAGAACSSRTTASGAACAGTGSTPARSD